jgi:hypothetical protein
VISEGRVFAYGPREAILNNPEVRRRYIGERFDVGHLLDRRRPASLPRPAVLPDSADPDHDDNDAQNSSYMLPGQTVSTDAFIGQLDHYTVEYSGTNPIDVVDDETDPSRSQGTDEDWG